MQRWCSFLRHPLLPLQPASGDAQSGAPSRVHCGMPYCSTAPWRRLQVAPQRRAAYTRGAGCSLAGLAIDSARGSLPGGGAWWHPSCWITRSTTGQQML